MKDYNKMAESVFARRDEYLVEQKKKKAMFYKALAPTCSLVLVTMVGLLMWQSKMPELPVKDPKPAAQQDVTSAETTEVVSDAPKTNCTHQYNNVPGAEIVTDSERTSCTAQYHFATEEPTVADKADNDIPQNTRPQQIVPEADSDAEADTPSCDLPATNGGSSSGVVRPGGATVPDATAGDYEEAPSVPLVDPEIPEVTFCTEATMPCTDSIWYPDEMPEVTYPFPNDIPTTTQAHDNTPEIPTTTEEPTGPLEIVLEGNTYTAEKGDKITYTAELWVEQKIEDVEAKLNFSPKKLEMIVPAGFENEDYSRMVPNMRTARVTYNDKSVKVIAFDVSSRHIDFCEEKVLMTVDFIVAGSGKAELELDLISASFKGKDYSYGGKPVTTGGITLTQSLTVTPADQIVPEEDKPVTPKPEPPEPDAFVYPEESTEGDLLIHCDSRTYAADIGQRITYVMELEADEEFLDYQLAFEYDKDILKLIIPEDDEENDIYKEDITAPYITDGLLLNYNVNTDSFYGIKLCGSNLKGYDFKRRKIFVQFDFIVESAGEIELDMDIQVISIDSERSYFTQSEASVTEGIQIYEYIIVR